MCIDFIMFEGEVPIVFSAQWVSRFAGRDVSRELQDLRT